MIRRNVPLGFAPLSVGLQTEDIGPDVVSNNYAPGQSSVSLIPLDVATPTLDAAGFAPDNAPRPDPITNACPG